MAMLKDYVRSIRSKNAGPFWLTFDVMFDDDDAYRKVRDAGVLSTDRIQQVYGVAADDIQIVSVDAARAIKVSIPRPLSQGALDDGDVLGGQQYAPLLTLEID